MNKPVMYALGALLASALFLPKAAALDLTLAWNRNPEPEVVGYKVYYSLGSYKAQVIDVGPATSIKISNLLAGILYRFSATAYTAEGLESPMSQDLTFTLPILPLPLPNDEPTTEPEPEPPAEPPANLDTDSDGLPDSFELANGLNPNDATDASKDADGDGVINLNEFLSGTSPANGMSSLQITAVTEQYNSVVVQHTSVSGKAYSLEANDNFPDGNWVPILAGIAGTGQTIQVSDASAGSSNRRMYRVVTTGPNNEVIASEPAGIQRLGLPGNSDTIISASLFRPAAFQGTVASVQGNRLQINGAGWAPNAFVYVPNVQSNTYFVLVRGGVREGDHFTITANGSNSIDVDLGGDSLSGIASGDRIAIFPYWTLGTLFPNGKGINASPFPTARNMEVLVPDMAASGINASTAHTYYFWNGAWREVGSGTQEKNDEVVLPDMYLWIRNSISTATEFSVTGIAPRTQWKFFVNRNPTSRQDNYFAIPRPYAITLNESGLVRSGAFRTSAFIGNRIDELLVFDNSAAASNKSAAATYYHWNGAWRKVGAGQLDFGNEPVFAPGTGFVIRVGAGTPDVTWTNEPEF